MSSPPGPTASAPGKILLAGEYAVLEGAEALVLAVDRRARATVRQRDQLLEGFLAAARDELAAHFGSTSVQARAAARIRADSSPLRAPDGTKLGLGSSAAVTVAAIAAGLAAGHEAHTQDRSRTVDRDLVHRLAHRAHGNAQAALGARGSGADIAAAVHGGLLAVARDTADEREPLRTRSLRLPADLHLLFVWTGQPAQTAELVARVLQFRDCEPARYRTAIDAIAEAASNLAAALADSADPTAAVSAIAEGGVAVADLGRTAGLDLETSLHRKLRAICQRSGGAFKPTGAGLGDMGVAAFGEESAALCFRHDAEKSGISVTDLSVDPTGVRIE